MSKQAIRAEIVGQDIAAAEGLSVRSDSPVLKLCRALLDAGHDPATPLEAYRGVTLCLRVRSIGAGARLTWPQSAQSVEGRPQTRQNAKGAV
jgi:hypothetical protein